MAISQYADGVEKKIAPSTLAEKYIVRFPDGMRARLHEAARANNRTLNAEILARLERSFELDGPEAKAELLALVNEAIDERLERERAYKAALSHPVKPLAPRKRA